MVKIRKEYLTPNKWSRPQTKLNKVQALVWHWVANPNSTAMANRNFFNNRTGSYGSTQYIVGLQGEIIKMMPENEMAYHVGSHVYTARSLKELGTYPNNNTLGIECTHIDWNGKMNKSTYDSLIDLSVDILTRHNLTADDIWLHQEVVGWKDCHRFYVNNQNEYKKAKEEVAKRMNQKLSNPPAKVNPVDVNMPNTNSNGEYTVQKGDTLWAISKAFDTTVANLEKLNPKVKADSLQIGAKIKVTNKSKPKQSTPSPKKNSVVWVGTNDKGERLEAIVSTVNYYDSQRWTSPTGQYKKGEGWVIDNLYKVNGSLQYRVQNSNGDLFYTTARKGLVKVVKSAENKTVYRPKANLKIDGYLGKQTITALQRYFNMKIIDGVVSSPSNVIKALQKLLGVKQDGYLGKITITALQKRFKMRHIDGVISKPSLVVKELQRRLNKGSL